MIEPVVAKNESERLQNLLEYNILDTLAEDDYDDLTKLASHICETPISLISLIDDKRQWFKSRQGLDVTETPKEYAFCAHALNTPEDIFQVHDSRLDERFHDNPLVTGGPHVIFYTGVPLVSPEGFALGTLCVIDNKPRVLNQTQLDALAVLSNQVVKLLELRRNKILLEQANELLGRQNSELERFAIVAAHDLKAPLRSITGIMSLMDAKYDNGSDIELKSYIKMIKNSSAKLSQLVTGILDHSHSEKWLSDAKVEISIGSFFEELISLLDPLNQYQFTYPKDDYKLKINKIALEQIFINLITNSIKYNDKEKIMIEMGYKTYEKHHLFYIRDNGRGISVEALSRIFDIYTVGVSKDRFGNKGNGIGLATVKKLIKNQGGEINVDSEVGKGTLFEFTILKD